MCISIVFYISFSKMTETQAVLCFEQAVIWLWGAHIQCTIDSSVDDRISCIMSGIFQCNAVKNTMEAENVAPLAEIIKSLKKSLYFCTVVLFAVNLLPMKLLPSNADAYCCLSIFS